MLGTLFYPALSVLLFFTFSLLALTQFPHRRATGAAELPAIRATLIRWVASVLLLLSLVCAVAHDGGGFGTLLWVGLMAVCACAVTLVLGWWPALLAPLARRMHRAGG